MSIGIQEPQDLPEGVLTTSQLLEQYEVRHFAAPFVAVIRKSDGAKGHLMFQHRPRFYYDFKEDQS
jgi:hypothetical protein